ncbi:serine hydrolase domain-containing protein [Maribacter sp. 2307ULW6-5]|uniref:serine hydrolase domain-containing protein n=1 Tax=Maribacter sp. 2307ULW6-5 TaxID=3386275 RepID=UPI0039BC2D20
MCFSHLDLLQKPSSKYIYSTYGFTLLSAVVEGASGEPFLDYLQNELFRPLKMDDTGPDLRGRNSTNMTELFGLDKSGKPYRIDDPEDPSYKWGGGGMVSTPSDLVKLGNAYLDGFIKNEMVDEAFKSQKLASGKETGVGIGWRRNGDMNTRPVFEHAGAMGGARSILGIFPEDGLVIAIMANTYSPRNVEETAHLMAIPFLRKETRVKQPQGKWDLTITVNDPNGKEIKESGYLILNGEDDRIVIDSEGLDKTTYPLFYMQTGNTYALAHRYGLNHTEIEHDSNILKVKSILYRSPRNQPPTEEKPFLSFIGKQLQEK